METYLSYFLYIATFFLGLFLDKKPEKNRCRIAYIVWLYVFLCFGYMTGSDWRAYELFFDDIKGPYPRQFPTEPGFEVIYYFFKVCIRDFFLVLGILKCIYLFTLLKLLKSYTKHYLIVVAILLPISSLFMLIDNPLRFMTALTIVNIAMIYLQKSKILICYCFVVLSIMFHNTALFFLILPIVIKNAYRVYNIPTIVLIPLYILILFISSNASLLSAIQNTTIGFILQHMEIKDYTQSYTAEDNEAFFTLGSIVRIGIFVLIILTKRLVNKHDKWESTIYGMTIFYLILERLLIMIPTGYRLAIPFGYFYAIYLAFLAIKKSRLGYIVITYIFLMMCKNLYSGYVYIPYTNSIYHIITQDYDSYGFRSDYNLEEYKKRTGRFFYDKN